MNININLIQIQILQTLYGVLIQFKSNSQQMVKIPFNISYNNKILRGSLLTRNLFFVWIQKD